MATRTRIESALPLPEAEEVQVRPDVRVAWLAARNHSVLSVGELHACGLSDDAIGVRVDNGRLHPMHRGVYAVGHAAPPLEGSFLGAVKACGEDSLLAGVAAGSHWEMMRWDHRLPEVLVIGRCAPRHPEINAHETSYLPPEDVRMHRGIPVTSPVRTLLDVAAILDHTWLRRAVRQAQSLGLVDLAVLDGRKVVPDFRWPTQRLVIEADGAAWHDNKLAREDDAERLALLEAHGERVLRVSWAQAVGRGGETLSRVRAAGAPIAESAVPRPQAG